MATAVTPRAQPASARNQPADAFVAFGITGDLAKVMTFRSLYRLERRGLLACPIIGVAVQDWSDDDLRAHARACIEGTGERVDGEVFDRSPARLPHISGVLGAPDTFAGLGRPLEGASSSVYYL